MVDKPLLFIYVISKVRLAGRICIDESQLAEFRVLPINDFFWEIDQGANWTFCYFNIGPRVMW
ncbi:hypothetical protein DSO57_1016566 [Entomophthora muscae]|uniref:Uncharacterized protein n=1 Tax=Entomophthora muscae TaxID=34485 RepID=A0ACC2RVW5_9FUNG|nr:hypothetical protein DSO57_1016566 [Entomophthora muscae]